MIAYRLGFIQRGCRRLIDCMYPKAIEMAPPSTPRPTWPVSIVSFEDIRPPAQDGASPTIRDIEKVNVDEGPFELCHTASELVVPYSLSVGLTVLGCFTAFFAALMTIRQLLKPSPELLQFFANILLAGTIICGKHSSQSQVNSRWRVFPFPNDLIM